MRKKITLMLLAVCTLSARASIQNAKAGTIPCNGQTEHPDLYAAITPTYLDGVLVTSPWNGNWFVGISG